MNKKRTRISLLEITYKRLNALKSFGQTYDELFKIMIPDFMEKYEPNKLWFNLREMTAGKEDIILLKEDIIFLKEFLKEWKKKRKENIRR